LVVKIVLLQRMEEVYGERIQRVWDILCVSVYVFKYFK